MGTMSDRPVTIMNFVLMVNCYSITMQVWCITFDLLLIIYFYALKTKYNLFRVFTNVHFYYLDGKK